MNLKKVMTWFKQIFAIQNRYHSNQHAIASDVAMGLCHLDISVVHGSRETGGKDFQNHPCYRTVVVGTEHQEP